MKMFAILFLLFTVTVRADLSVYFSPQDDCAAVWTNTICRATNHVYVSCYGIENRRIVSALISQHQKGISVKVCIDLIESTARGSLVSSLRQAGIEVVVKKSPV